MATNKLPNLGFKQVGQNLNVTVELEGDVKVLTLKGSKEVLTPVKDLLKQYLEKKSPKLHKEIMALMTPKTTKEKVEKEEKATKVKAEIKANKNKIKSLPKAKINKTESITDLALKIKEGKLPARDLALIEEAIKASKPQAKPSVGPSRRGEY